MSDAAAFCIAVLAMVVGPIAFVLVSNREAVQAKRRRRAFRLGFEEGKATMLDDARWNAMTCPECRKMHNRNNRTAGL
jgi:hypothetical protein